MDEIRKMQEDNLVEIRKRLKKIPIDYYGQTGPGRPPSGLQVEHLIFDMMEVAYIAAQSTLQERLDKAFEILSYVSGDQYGKDAQKMAIAFMRGYSRDQKNCPKCEGTGDWQGPGLSCPHCENGKIFGPWRPK